jgi:hypothetical protein
MAIGSVIPPDAATNDLSFLIGTAVILTTGDYALVWIGCGFTGPLQ